MSSLPPISSPSAAHRLHLRSLRTKILAAVTLTCLLTILLASVALFAHQALRSRQQFQTQMEALSRMVADYSVAPVSFNSQSGMQEALAVLASRPEVRGAQLFDNEHHLLQSYGAPTPPPLPVAVHPTQPSSYDGWNLFLVQPLAVGNEPLGQLTMTAFFRPVFIDAGRNFIPAMALVVTGALIFVVTVTWFLAGFLLSGLQTLATSASHIARTGDYSVRATSRTADEVGQLTTTFNAMLDRLQSADQNLRTTNRVLNMEIAERARLEKALVESSRFAGMAEVATGVLHNVGNVLNSVNVSAQLVRERLEGSRLATLGRTAALLAPHRDDPTVFYTTDPKARQLPRFLCELHAALVAEQAEIRTEMLTLNQNIEHIKEVVAAQQSFARNAGIEESIAAADLVEDVLRIQQPSLQRHEIQLARDDEPDLRLVADRHTTLQILINLVSNAIHAVKEQPITDRRITLATFGRGSKVVFSVRDFGVGIAPGNLTRIFQHGFTTRSDGHGFGLHSGANAARSMGGALTANSAGSGCGATFQLELPRNRPSQARPLIVPQPPSPRSTA